MKRLIPFALAAALVFYTAPAAAQGLGVGVKAGATISSWSGDNVENVESKAGFGIGGFATVGIAPTLALQPEVFFMQKGSSFDIQDATASLTSDMTVSYVEIPVLARLGLPTPGGMDPFVIAGPSLGFETSCTISAADTDTDCADADTFERSSTDFGFVVGGGIGLGMGLARLDIDARYNLGLSDLNASESGGSLKNRALSIMVGLALSL